MSCQTPTACPLDPGGEEARLDVLRGLDLLDTTPEQAFDDIVRLASHVCGVPIALVSLVDADRQWFKARVGLDMGQTPRGVSFCAHALSGNALDADGLLVVPDAAQDARFASNPHVAGDPHVRFYAGAPLVTPEGHVLGTLCVLDHQPRVLTAEQRDALASLGRIVMAQIEMRRANARQAALNAERERSEQRLRLLESAVENANDVILITEAEPVELPGPRVVYVNPAFTRMTGYAPEEIIGQTPRLLQGPKTSDRARDTLRASLKAWEPVQVELLNYRKDGTEFWVELNIRPVADETGWYTHWVAVQRDITERKRAEDRLRLLESVVTHANDAVVITEAEPVSLPGPRIVYVNEAFTRNTGYTLEEVVGKTPRMLHGPDPDPAVADRIRAALRRWKPVRVQTKNYRKDGTEFWVDFSIVPVADETGWYTHWVSIQRDITAQKLASDELERRVDERTAELAAANAALRAEIVERSALEADRERLLEEALERADRDPLTGLLNHRAFHHRLQQEAERALREDSPLTLAVLDLDNFKFFNDAYGHPAGDDVLRRVADWLQEVCRPYDVLSRFGGDEFALLVPGAGPAEAERLEERLRAHLREQGYRPPGAEVALPLGVTVGMAVFPLEGPGRLDVLALADARLRRAKTGGGRADPAELVRLRAAGAVQGFSMLDALVTAVDAKDRYTRRHSEDVMAHCLRMAVELGLDEPERDTLAVAALLHDVGKIGVPDAVLRKPGRLTDDEFAAIRQHPMMGWVMAGAVPGLEATLGAIRHHHERWDGGGYPDGLRDTETPLAARIMAVADAFSAMTTDRPYRKGMDPARAMRILEEGAGTQWDPACVAVFVRASAADPKPAPSAVVSASRTGRP